MRGASEAPQQLGQGCLSFFVQARESLLRRTAYCTLEAAEPIISLERQLIGAPLFEQPLQREPEEWQRIRVAPSRLEQLFVEAYLSTPVEHQPGRNCWSPDYFNQN